MGGAARQVAFLWGDWHLWLEQVSPDLLVRTFPHLGPTSTSTFFWTHLGHSGLSPSPWVPVTLFLLFFPCRPLYVRCPFSMDGLQDGLSYPSPSSGSLFLLEVPAPPSGPQYHASEQRAFYISKSTQLIALDSRWPPALNSQSL